jgi:hypothetical protein
MKKNRYRKKATTSIRSSRSLTPSSSKEMSANPSSKPVQARHVAPQGSAEQRELRCGRGRSKEAVRDQFRALAPTAGVQLPVGQDLRGAPRLSQERRT